MSKTSKTKTFKIQHGTKHYAPNGLCKVEPSARLRPRILIVIDEGMCLIILSIDLELLEPRVFIGFLEKKPLGFGFGGETSTLARQREKFTQDFHCTLEFVVANSLVGFQCSFEEVATSLEGLPLLNGLAP
jgi:hypothetical protein